MLVASYHSAQRHARSCYISLCDCVSHIGTLAPGLGLWWFHRSPGLDLVVVSALPLALVILDINGSRVQVQVLISGAVPVGVQLDQVVGAVQGVVVDRLVADLYDRVRQAFSVCEGRARKLHRRIVPNPLGLPLVESAAEPALHKS